MAAAKWTNSPSKVGVRKVGPLLELPLAGSLDMKLPTRPSSIVTAATTVPDYVNLEVDVSTWVSGLGFFCHEDMDYTKRSATSDLRRRAHIASCPQIQKNRNIGHHVP